MRVEDEEPEALGEGLVSVGLVACHLVATREDGADVVGVGPGMVAMVPQLVGQDALDSAVGDVARPRITVAGLGAKIWEDSDAFLDSVPSHVQPGVGELPETGALVRCADADRWNRRVRGQEVVNEGAVDHSEYAKPTSESQV